MATDKKILFLCGESSGEINAAQLIHELKRKRKNLSFTALGGDNCENEGAKLIHHIKELGIVGFKAAVQKLPTALKIRKDIIRYVEEEKPDLIIPVDFPDFNLSLLEKLKKFKIPVVYFISPQVWAWRRGRIKKIRRLVNRMLVLLPFEEAIYREAGIDVKYVGNPAVDRVRTTMSGDEFAKKHHLDKNKKRITFLPGSRFHEIEDILPIFLETIKRFKDEDSYEFLIAPATTVDNDKTLSIIKKHNLADSVHLLPGEAWNASAYSDLVVTKSGTSTIEVALLDTPMIVVYKTTFLAYSVARLWYKNAVSLVNIIGGGETVTELIQDDFTPERLYSEIKELMENTERRNEILQYIRKVRTELGQGGAPERAAEAVLEVLEA